MTSANNTVLVVEDDAALAEALSDTLGLAGYEVFLADDGESALDHLQSKSVDLVVSDVHMKRMDGHALLKQLRQRHPDIPAMLMTAYGSIEKAVEAMRDGAVDYLVKPFEAEVLVNMVARYIGQVKQDVSDVVAQAPATKELMALAQRVAQKDVTVMITGQSGTGKEVLARYIHQNSPRAAQPFLAINCAAIPENMLEATLFGYEKGAFTGAYKACPGKFELANGGTLLLDEISEMDLGLQSKLLRVLQEREVERLGGNNLIQLDVRILATSNRNMHAEVKAGRFREDLFYRLNVFPLHVLALRDRKEDILPLAELLVERHALHSGAAVPTISDSAAEKLTSHAWPGNVRELENVVQRALVLCDGSTINPEDLHFEAVTSAVQTASTVGEETSVLTTDDTADSKADTLNTDLKQREWDLIVDALRNTQGSRKATAERLGISERTLRYKLARMRDAGIKIPGEIHAHTA
jgi:two-component system response regulator FlrC